MKYSIIIGFGLLVSLFIFLPNFQADGGQRYQVDSETATLRDAPEQEATILAELKNEDEVTIFQESFGWGQTYYQGEEAWVAIDQLASADDSQTETADSEQTSASAEQESGETFENGRLYQVTTSSLQVREDPDENAGIMTKLGNGDEVTIFQESDGWGKTYYDDKEGWVSLYLLDEKDDSANDGGSNVSEKPDAEQAPKVNEKEKSKTESDQKDDKDDDENDEKEVKAEGETEQSEEKPLSGHHFVIDPGHGGEDTGAIAFDTNEKTLTLETAKKVEEELHDHGASVTLTRSDDTFIPLGERADISNSSETDAFISLHYNSAEDQSTSGIDTFYYDGEASQALANTMQQSLADKVDLPDLGTDQADFQVLRDNEQPAILMELGFISNQEDKQLIQTEDYQKKAAKGIVAGLEDNFIE